MRFMVDKMTLGQVFLPQFSSLSISLPILDTYIRLSTVDNVSCLRCVSLNEQQKYMCQSCNLIENFIHSLRVTSSWG